MSRRKDQGFLFSLSLEGEGQGEGGLPGQTCLNGNGVPHPQPLSPRERVAFAKNRKALRRNAGACAK